MSQAGKPPRRGMSEQKRDKLLNIQKREQLKGMLIHKFKLKYGDKAEAYINNEVGKFLSNNRLTEENLKKLDEKIGKEADLRAKKQDVLADHVSVKSGASRGGRPQTQARKEAGTGQRGDLDDVMSVKSYASSRMSGASRASKGGDGKLPAIAVDAKSMRSDVDSVYSRPMSSYSNLNEEDEWTAIMNFNTILHYEEQKQSLL